MPEIVAFFSLEVTADKGGVLGAILATDDLGKPEEFRVTYPVKPTALQKQLYGEALYSHVGINLCGVPLYNALRGKPELLIVSDKRFLQISQSVDCRVAHLQRAGEAFEVESSSTAGQTSGTNLLSSDGGRYQPLNLAWPRDYGDADIGDTKVLLAKYFQMIDLLEPFNRIAGAVEALLEQDERFR